VLVGYWTEIRVWDTLNANQKLYTSHFDLPYSICWGSARFDMKIAYNIEN
jgi:hypothetical protein